MPHKDSTPLTLDESHRYRIGDRELAGVTSIIRSCDYGYAVGDWYLERGHAVHTAIQLELQHKLDWKSVDTRIEARVKAALKFIEDAALSVIAVERRLWSPSLQYAGTLDLVGKSPEQVTILVDWKGSYSPHVEPQLSAYAHLLKECDDIDVDMAACLVTNDDGTYKAHWYKKPDLKLGLSVFRSMLSVHSWRNKHNLIPKEKQNDSK